MAETDRKSHRDRNTVAHFHTTYHTSDLTLSIAFQTVSAMSHRKNLTKVM